MRENIWWERIFKAGTIFIMICFGIALLVATYKMAKANEIYTVLDENGNIQFTNIPQIEVKIEEPVQVDIQEDDYFEHYLDRQLLRQEEDIEQWWEEDYRDNLRRYGVPEGLMGGW